MSQLIRDGMGFLHAFIKLAFDFRGHCSVMEEIG